ncbi:MAG: ribulokinase, partial [Planctomycetes bacterium]|nr:ribulokinase [Planctomycetota bacterium]
MAATTYSLGLDFGTSSVRALIARVADGREVGLAVAPFPHGVGGVIGDERNPNVARQTPVDYKTSVEVAVQQA